MTILFVDDAESLASLCEQLKASTWLAVDTEFHREKTYYPQLCLVQVANDDVIACIDPLKIDDLTPLLDIFYQPSLTLVFHAARQDLELFYLLRQALPERIFDTQLAATVLGYGDQIGYGNLVKQCLNVELEKAHARTDWRQRPLSQEQIDYAADDVRYLRDLYHLLNQRLQETGRTTWLREDFSTLSAIDTYQPDPEQSWRRIKGAGRLKGLQLAVLQQLSSWREQKAIRQDLPRRWVIKDDVMLDLARFAPTTTDGMSKIRGFEKRDVDRHGEALIEVINAAKSLPKEKWPELKKPVPLTNQQDAIVDVLMGLLRKFCDDQSITPSAVATRKDLEKIVAGEQDTTLLQGWRNEIVGHHLKQFLDGQASIAIDNGQLQIQSEFIPAHCGSPDKQS